MRQNKAGGVAWLALALGIAMVVVTLLWLFPAWAQYPGVGEMTSSDDWETVFSETFSSELGVGWTAVDASDADGGNYAWGTDTFTFTSPSYSAWSVGGGTDGSSLTGGADTYPDRVDSWLVYGPVELSGLREASVEFDWWLETDATPDAEDQATRLERVAAVSAPPEEGDWLGWCVLTGENDFENARCEYVSGSIGRWSSGLLTLDETSGNADRVWIAFHFVSDDDGAGGRGAFVDDVVMRAQRGYSVALPLIVRRFYSGHRVVLPLVRKDARPVVNPTPTATPSPQPGNLLENGGFEASWEAGGGTHRAVRLTDGGGAYEENKDDIFSPPGWLTWFHHSPGTGEEPDVNDVREPRRVHSGSRAIELATVYSRHEAGLLQQVDVEPGTRLKFSAWAHAWSNWHDGPHPGDPFWSEGPGYDCGFRLEGDAPDDNWANFIFQVGIDPTGGIDPDADSVEWGSGAHIYNCYHQVPAVEVEAQSRRVTVFLRSRTAWAFWHNNAFWDDAVLVIPDGDGDGSDWTYPTIGKGSRIGVHSILPNRVGGFTEELVAGGTHFPVVKGVDDLGWLAGIKESSPETIIVARVSSSLEGCGNVEDFNTDLDEMANALLSVILNRLTQDARLRGVVEYWEVVNEPDPPGPEGYRRLAELMIKCMEKAERYGLKLAIFSLNAGTPEWEEMKAMVGAGAFARAKEGGHILALHEGTFATNDPREGWGQTIPGAPQVDGAGNLNFRYRYLYHLLKKRDQVIPLVVSEWYCGDEASASTQTLVNAVKWYESEASEDYYFWATLPFTLGPTGQWWHTDYERVYPDLVDYMIEIRDRENGVISESSLWERLLRRLVGRR
jgi:hypothetical protein